MSKIGKRPILLPKGVTTQIKSDTVVITGPKGACEKTLPTGVQIQQNENQIFITTQGTGAQNASHWNTIQGTIRSHIKNMIQGVSEGFQKELDIVGAGYRAQVLGKKLNIYLGFTHPINYDIPAGIIIEVPKPTSIIIKGVNKELVGRVAGEIRGVMRPEPYKGKGIRYNKEIVRKKAGKAVAGK
ncbi:50S ribosomal protein L6 [bacterium Unc6]|nr:50S ribosomal protein L6 [bacterium Unc6]